ncbi:MAG: FtsX-like permease family protein, partial [Vicinamibacterales bacterium]
MANTPVFMTPMNTSGGTSATAGEAKSVYVTPGWFETYGLPFIAGRDLQADDTATSPPVMVVNRAFVDRFFPGRSGLGESPRVGLGNRGAKALLTRTIVGIVGNAIYRSPREAHQPTIYLPLTQYDYPLPVSAYISIGVRSAAGVPAALAKDVSTAIAAVNPRLTVTTRTLSSQVDDSVRQEHILARLSTLFGAMALFLAATGLFGVTSYGVARRRSELAVRIALGANGADVMRDVLLRVVAPVALGLAGGAVLSTWLARFVSALFFGVTPGDPTSLLIGTLALASTALVAAWIPARRALRIDPVRVLRAS